MLKLLLLLFALAAGLTAFYGFFYETSTPGATYPITYSWLSLGAAIIFSGLFYALIVNREKSEANVLLK